MISFISNSKKFLLNYTRSLKAVFIALAIIFSIELSISHLLKNHDIPQKIYKENLLKLTPLKNDPYPEYTIAYKNSVFLHEEPDLLIVGDSSGLNGAKPLTIERYLSEKKVINAACCANANFDGYLAVATHFFQNSKNIKYLLLYITPYGLPSGVQKKFGNDFGEELLGVYAKPWHYIYELPSVYFRKSILDKTYRYKAPQDAAGNYENMNYFIKQTTGSDENYIDFIKKSRGWIPRIRDNKFQEMLRGECGPQLTENLYDEKSGKPTLIKTLTKFKNLTDKYNAKLVIIFNPVVCKLSPQVYPVIAELDKFKEKNPDVIIPFGLIHTYNEEYFGNQNHLNPEGAEKYSIEIGEKLSEVGL